MTGEGQSNQNLKQQATTMQKIQQQLSHRQQQHQHQHDRYYDTSSFGRRIILWNGKKMLETSSSP
jgi:hypothetical protein